MHLTLDRWAATYGKIFRFQLGPKSLLAIADSEAALHERPDRLSRPEPIEEVADSLRTKGVFAAER